LGIEVGRPAPDFTLLDSNRQPRKLSDFRGKVVVLAFFPGAFTGGCTTEWCTFRDNEETLKGLQAQVIGVSVDPPVVQKTWAEANRLPFTLLSDYNRQVTNTYDVAWRDLAGMEGYVAANRAVFVLDAEGIVRYRWVAPNPGTQPDLEEIVRALDALRL